MSLLKEIEEKIANITKQLEEHSGILQNTTANLHILNGARQAYIDMRDSVHAAEAAVKDGESVIEEVKTDIHG